MSAEYYTLHARTTPKHELRVTVHWYAEAARPYGSPGPYFELVLHVWAPDQYHPEEMRDAGGPTLFVTPAQVRTLRDALTAALVEHAAEPPLGNRLRNAYDLGVQDVCDTALARGCQVSPENFDYEQALARERAHRESMTLTGTLVPPEAQP